MPDLSDQALALLHEQTASWDVLRDSRAGMAAAEVREFDFGRFRVRAQFNRGRLKLCSAPVDPHAIRDRECFLCDANRPAEQASVPWKYGFKLLCNPYPILPEHFTVVQTQHRPQRIAPDLAKMLELARDMHRFTIFYNGPQCGASAPDHMHFQAGTKGYMPIETDHAQVAKLVQESEGVRTFMSQDYLRQFIAFESSDSAKLEAAFMRFHERLHELQPQAEEPMMNVLCRFDGSQWRLIATVRSKHRPDRYFKDEPNRMLISPGTIDMSGILVVPREQDFEQLTPQIIEEIYAQVTLPEDLFQRCIPG